MQHLLLEKAMGEVYEAGELACFRLMLVLIIRTPLEVIFLLKMAVTKFSAIQIEFRNTALILLLNACQNFFNNAN